MERFYLLFGSIKSDVWNESTLLGLFQNTEAVKNSLSKFDKFWNFYVTIWESNGDGSYKEIGCEMI